MSDIPILGDRKVLNLQAKGQKIAAVDTMTRNVQRLLGDIAGYFFEPNVTLVVRASGQDFILTNDSTNDAVAALERHRGEAPTRETELREALDLALYIMGKSGAAADARVMQLYVALTGVCIGGQGSSPEALAMIAKARAEIETGAKETVQ